MNQVSYCIDEGTLTFHSEQETISMQALLQVILAGLVTGSLYGLLALGITLVYRTTGVLNFAYGAIGAVCACFMYILLSQARLNFWLALLITLLCAPLLGVVLERGFARPVLNAPIFTKAIATLALALVLQALAQQLWPQLNSALHFPTPFEGHAARVGGVYISLVDVIILVITLLIMVGLNLFLTRSRLGIAMRATADGLSAARMVGIPVGLIFLFVWALSAFIAALAGILLASLQSLIDIQFMDSILLFAFVGAVLGGLDSLPGALIGGILIGFIDNLLAFLLANHALGTLNIGDPGIREALIFSGFVLILFLRPQGLFGKTLARRV
jgi:branched-chain amino acid transport system permease protein